MCNVYYNYKSVCGLIYGSYGDEERKKQIEESKTQIAHLNPAAPVA